MEGTDPRAGPVEDLDALIRDFAESGYAPEGAEVGDDSAPPHGTTHEPAGEGSVRRFEYRGHAVEIVTRYEVMIDGDPWEGQIAVRLDGTVTYHGLPQYAVPSAVDLLRGVIDTAYEAPEEVRDAIRAAREEE